VNSSAIRVLVVEDFEAWRGFVRSTFQREPKFQIIGEARDGFEAIQKAQELEPDLVLLDVGLPLLNGIEAARRIREVVPQAKILFLSEAQSWDIVREAVGAGASGYVVKADAGKDLLPAVNAVLGGARFFGARFDGKEFSGV
jgi:DNA-binding NarL/FixJ family response regulator